MAVDQNPQTTQNCMPIFFTNFSFAGHTTLEKCCSDPVLVGVDPHLTWGGAWGSGLSKFIGFDPSLAE